MRKPTILLAGCVVAWMLGGLASAQDATQTTPTSLGDLARQVKADKGKLPKPVRVITNDNMPVAHDTTDESASSTPAATDARTTADASGPKRDENYFRTRMTELQDNLSTHQRELEVLQQRLGQGEMQYYNNPAKTLQQEYTRSDINRLRQDIETKKQQIADDEKAIEDLRTELQRANGDPGWLQPGPASAPAGSSSTAVSAPSPTSEKGTKPEATAAKTRDDWEAEFAAARKALAKAREKQQLAEDELNLLQIQEARTLEAGAKAELTAKVQAKQSDVEDCKHATAEAERMLAELERAFRESGAPRDWHESE